MFLLGLFGSVSSSAASDPAQVANGWSTPPVPAAAPAALIDLSKSPIGADDRGTYWATFDPVPSTQAPAPGALPTSPTVITEPDKTDKANGNGDEKKDEGLKIEEDEWKLLPPGWNLHGQTTLIQNFDPGIRALYSGPNSLSTQRDREGSISADLFVGAPLWQGAELHFDLLMWQGFGLSNSFGLEAFPNGDAYKAGTETPRFMAAHLFVRQTIGLGGEQQDVPDGQLTLPGKQDI